MFVLVCKVITSVNRRILSWRGTVCCHIQVYYSSILSNGEKGMTNIIFNKVKNYTRKSLFYLSAVWIKIKNYLLENSLLTSIFIYIIIIKIISDDLGKSTVSRKNKIIYSKTNFWQNYITLIIILSSKVKNISGEIIFDKV